MKKCESRYLSGLKMWEQRSVVKFDHAATRRRVNIRIDTPVATLRRSVKCNLKGKELKDKMKLRTLEYSAIFTF